MKVFGATLSFVVAIGSMAAAIEPAGSVTCLPDWINVESAKFEIVADYSSLGPEGGVLVYLINNTETDIRLEAQDGDVYLKLEVKGEDGQWSRAQPHRFSWCGNSYDHSPVIGSRQFIVVDGYQPTTGNTQPIRYSLYRQDVQGSSNVGEGLVDEQDVERASRDSMAVRTGDLEAVSKAAISESAPGMEIDPRRDLRGEAILALASPRFEAERSREALREVLKQFPERKTDVDLALREIEINTIRDRDFGDLADVALADGASTNERLQKAAISALVSPRFDLEMSLSALSRVLAKHPERVNEVTVALIQLHRVAADQRDEEVAAAAKAELVSTTDSHGLRQYAVSALIRSTFGLARTSHQSSPRGPRDVVHSWDFLFLAAAGILPVC